MATTIVLEFRREGSDTLTVNGSDAVTFLDGRWNRNSQTDHVWWKLQELRRPERSQYRDLHFVGYSVLGESRTHDSRKPHVSMSDPEPPAWVPSVPGRNPALWA